MFWHDEGMTLDDVIRAHAGIDQAERAYRDVLRAARAARVPQKAIAEALGVTREDIRVDSMPEDRRAAYLAAKSEAAKARRQSARRKALSTRGAASVKAVAAGVGTAGGTGGAIITYGSNGTGGQR